MYIKILELLETKVDEHKSSTNSLKLDFRERVSQGKYVGGTLPFGYRIHDNIIYKNSIRIESYTANIVRVIFEAYAGGSSTKAIAEGLNLLRIPTPSNFSKARKKGISEYKVQKSKDWSSSSINKMLKNTTYMGLIIYGSQTRVKGGNRQKCSNVVEVYNENLAIISKDLFERVQSRFNKTAV